MRRNKTDADDAAALFEAARCAEIRPVCVKSVEQQALQALHRTRSPWQGDLTRRINTLRGYCREFGIVIAQGARLGLEQIARELAEPRSGIPELLRPTMVLLVEEVRLVESRVSARERERATLACLTPACSTLAVGARHRAADQHGDGCGHFGRRDALKDARHFASCFGLKPKEHLSGQRRHLGRIRKQKDRTCACVLTLGARSVLRAAAAARNAGKPVQGLRA